MNELSLEHAARIAELLAVPPGHFIDSGVAGWAFEAGNDILKLTSWIEEAESWARIGRQQKQASDEMRGFATALREPVGVRLPDGNKLYAIVRENLADAPVEWSKDDLGKLDRLRGIVRLHYRGKRECAVDFFNVLSTMPGLELAYRAIRHLYESEEALAGDLTPSNFGLRAGSDKLVIRDPGFAIGKDRWQPAEWVSV